MARIRTVKPEFWTDEKMAKLSRDARLVYIGLWNHSDDKGICRGNPTLLRSQLFPFTDPPYFDQDMTPEKFIGILRELEQMKRIYKFSAGGEDFYLVKNFPKHQKIDRPSAGINPAPPPGLFDEPSPSPRRAIDEDSPQDQGSGNRDKEQGKEHIGRPKASPLSPPGLDQKFEEFWKVYPQAGRHAKVESRKKFGAILKAGRLEELVSATAGYIDFLAEKKNDERFDQRAMYAKTFLNGRWEEFIGYKRKVKL